MVLFLDNLASASWEEVTSPDNTYAFTVGAVLTTCGINGCWFILTILGPFTVGIDLSIDPPPFVGVDLIDWTALKPEANIVATFATLVITSNIEPLKTVSGKAAVLCNPNNIYDIKNKFIYLQKNKLLQNELIRKGIINSNKYHINELGKKYKMMYEKFLENESQKMYNL